MTDTLTIARPDDWHLHFRDGELLAETVPATANVFGRAIVMPNLTPPVNTVAQAAEYRERIMAQVPAVAERRLTGRVWDQQQSDGPTVRPDPPL